MNDQNFAREIQDQLEKDFPNTTKLRAPQAAVQGTPEDRMALFLRAGDLLLRERRERLSQLEFDYEQRLRNLAIEHEKATTALRAEIAVLSRRMGFE